jgi:hypothetical protein
MNRERKLAALEACMANNCKSQSQLIAEGAVELLSGRLPPNDEHRVRRVLEWATLTPQHRRLRRKLRRGGL